MMPMKRSLLRLLPTAVLTGSLLLLGGCSSAEGPAPLVIEHTASFTGFVYDGASGSQLTAYTIEALVRDVQLAGSVAADGRFALGPIGVWSDYTVIISADGYRLFRSHNPKVGLPPELSGSDDIASISSRRVLYFDAYLFPMDLQAPGAIFTISTPVEGESVGGSIRLRPISPSLLADEGAEIPAGVAGQIWYNDEDLQGQSVADTFGGGSYELAAGALLYGVTYLVDIYSVAGYQPFQGTYVAGVEAGKTFTLEPEVSEPLVLVSSNADSCSPPSSPNVTEGAVVVLQFNQDIELVNTGYPGGAAEAADDGISISSPDANSNGTVNTLKDDLSNSAQERGVSLSTNGGTLQITWDPSAGLVTKDAGDPIASVTYGGLANVELRRQGAPQSLTSLAALIGTGSITCSN